MAGDIGFVRNPIADMVGYLNDGLRDLMDRRPYLLLDEAGSHTANFQDITTSNFNSEALPVGEEYREGLAHYIASRIFEIDQNDEHNVLQARHHFKQYKTTT